MRSLSEPAIENPKRLSFKLCAAIVLSLAVAHVGLSVFGLRERRAALIDQVEACARTVLSALGEERDPDVLRERLSDLRYAGVTRLRVLDYDAEELVVGEGDLTLRSQGLEVQMSLRGVEAQLDDYGRSLLTWTLVGMLAASLGAGLFVFRSRTISAAERVDLYARRLERQNEELREAMQRAESADHAKTEFLANVSHELRTPLTAILGFTDLVKEDAEARGATEADLDNLGTIARNSQYLYRLLSGVLDFSNLEAGRFQIDWLRCAPAEILRDIATINRPQAEAKGLRFRTEVGDDVPDTITSDPTRIRQLLASLVENAIKFTREGSVSLRLTLLREGVPQPCVAFDVIDTGIGMTEAQRATMFDPFRQGDGSRSRQHGGLGLGLALGRRLARLLKGEITAVSTPDEGSAFRLTVPVSPNLEPEERPSESALQASAQPLDCHVLVAEDGADNRKLIERLLRQAGARVALVDNGREAVDTARSAWEAEEPFDLILMDMQMPGTDGIGATQALRLAGYPGLIVALTADARAANREDCLRAGCDEFLSKPIDRDKLIATLQALIKSAR